MRLFVLSLLLVTAICAWIYSFGVHSGYYFDDYGQLVLNDALKFSELTWDNFWRAANSSSAGPIGRQIVMASFALETYFFGDGPEHFKWVNLAIHLVNGLLIAGVLRMILGVALGESKSSNLSIRWYVLLITAWWLFHPINLTAVLYVVQRMTSLSATFTLLGLCSYTVFRKRAIVGESGKHLALALGGLTVGTALATYSKENGILTFAYAWLLEMLIFRCRLSDIQLEKIWHYLCRWIPAGVALAGMGFFLMRPEWLANGYAGRPFTLEERLLTESRVLWFYVQQLLIPSMSSFGLYLDDFILSKSIIQPWMTLAALLAHVITIGAAFVLRQKRPLLVLGIAWFYVGHSIESTVVPLELVFEHRNYLPGLGALLCVVTAASHLQPKRWRRSQFALFGCLIIFCAGITWQRSASMADFFGYSVLDAERHPESSRANFDAGMVLISAISMRPELAGEFVPRIHQYLNRSILSNPNSLAPFIAILRLSQVTGEPVSEQDLLLFEERLRTGIPPAATGYIAQGLIERLADIPVVMSHANAKRLYQAALANPKLKGYSRTLWLTGYALFLHNLAEEREHGLSLMREAVARSPGHADLYILLAAMLVDQGRLDEAIQTLNRAEKVDKHGYLQLPLGRLRQRIEVGPDVKD